MAIRVPRPTKYHNATTATFKRTLAEAFPYDALHVLTDDSPPPKKRSRHWLISAFLTTFAALALTGCSRSAWLCPGMTATKLSETTVQCTPNSHEN